MRAQAAALAALVLAARVQAAGPVILSEFMAANTRTLADERRSFEDWIEIRNGGSHAVDLAGWGEISLCPTNRALDFLCLTNPNPFAVDFSGWRLDGAVKFTFEGGTVVPAHGLLCVSPDVKAFRSRPPAESGRVRFVVGNYSGRLDRARPTVLKNAAGRTIVER